MPSSHDHRETGPLFGGRFGLPRPSRGSLAWYVGLGAMTAFEVIEWPVALVIAASHALTTHAQDPTARELAEGTQAGT